MDCLLGMQTSISKKFNDGIGAQCTSLDMSLPKIIVADVTTKTATFTTTSMAPLRKTWIEVVCMFVETPFCHWVIYSYATFCEVANYCYRISWRKVLQISKTLTFKDFPIFFSITTAPSIRLNLRTKEPRQKILKLSNSSQSRSTTTNIR